jgi:hypothetical protein
LTRVETEKRAEIERDSRIVKKRVLQKPLTTSSGNRAVKMTGPNAAGLQVLGKGGGGLGWSRSGPAKRAGTAAIARWPDL